MLTDRHGLNLSTTSTAARDAYDRGCDLMLGAYPGAPEAFAEALAADPDLALAHVAIARMQQMRGDMPAARAALAEATRLAPALSPREASHIAYFNLVFTGQSEAALAALTTHLEAFPRDAMALSTCMTPSGLLGFSGRLGREREQVEFLAPLVPHYENDGWFAAHHAHALIENGQNNEAIPFLDCAATLTPRSPWMAHARAHLHYEQGEPQEARTFLAAWLPGYTRDGALNGHLSWHLALSELAAGNTEAAFGLYRTAFGPGAHRGHKMIQLGDAVAFLWRAELAGAKPDPAHWQAMHDFARSMFPRAGTAFADWHVALTDAAAGDTTALDARLAEIDQLAQNGRYPAAPVIPALARAFAAFRQQDYNAAIAAIAPVVTERERIGGSRAQTDLVDFTLLRAYVAAGRLEEMQAMLARRRPGPGPVPVAGLVH
ncbi:MAG: tetratricopeptide repeat protein [Alphaproteobacteria bacterium]|nr:tetratricopeptide repeat protein [Alphaproteobacteria bacterium]